MNKSGIVNFLLDNHIWIIVGIFMGTLIRRLVVGEKMEPIIGQRIDFDQDRSIIYPDGNGGHVRVFKETN